MENPESRKGKGGRVRKIIQTLSRCRTLTSSSRGSSSSIPFAHISKSKSWPCQPSEQDDQNNRPPKCRVAREGCFSVYVGPEKERFVIKTEFLNHPLFKMLLEEAEMEYGFDSQGPIALPCDVDFFQMILSEMDSKEIVRGCGLTKGLQAYRLLSPARV